MIDPIRGLLHGSRTYWLGVKWLGRHRFWLFMLLIPSLLGLGCMALSFGLFWNHQAQILRVLLFEPGEGWVWVLLYYACKAFLFLAALGFSLLCGLLLSNILAAPLYEFLSCAVEKDRNGRVADVSLWHALRMIPHELIKVFLIVLLSLLLFVIPGLNMIGIFGAACLVGWDYYDYPMARRAWPLQRRLNCARQDIWVVLGFGLWLVIPFAHFILMPMAVVGGTLLGLERIDTIERRAHGS